MSLEYCEECDRMIDLDVDLEHEHFNLVNLNKKTLGRDGKLADVYSCGRCDIRTIFPDEHICEGFK